MNTAKERLFEHLKTGATTTCRVWKVQRKDGLILGFTDHDRDLEFEGTAFKADSGLTTGATQRASGLSVDNAEIIGALSNDAISEADLRAGRYDGAEVTTWLVNWNDVAERVIRFRGNFGEVTLSKGEFRVELRGLTESLNHNSGRIYQPTCSAILGDRFCGIDLLDPLNFEETVITLVEWPGRIHVQSLPSRANGVFEWGTAEILSGEAIGMVAGIRADREERGNRILDLPIGFNISPAEGDAVRLTVGCEKSMSACFGKFANIPNFRGFPHVPGADWMAAYPASSQVKDGRSRYK